MKMILASLLLATVPPWVSSTVAWACDCDDDAKNRVVVVTDGKVITGDHDCVISGTDEGAARFLIKVGGDVNDGRSEGEEKFVWVSGKAGGEERGWLGVSIGNVPEALAAQLEIEDRGIIVLDVVDDSPADHAGLRVHDIILSVEDDVVEGDVGKAVDLIKSRKPGDEVDIVLLRDGREKTITVELGSRGEVKDLLKWTPQADIEERIKTRGKILRQKDGKWIFENLGDLGKLKVPKHIEMFIPKSGSRSTKIYAKGDKKKVTTKVERDGTIIAITQEGDGPITVKKVEDGEESEITYADEDELREADEEAYELWKDVGDSVTLHLDVDAIEIPEIEIPHIEIPEFEFEFDSDEWKKHSEEWKTHLDESLGEAKEYYERAMEEFREAMEQLREGEGFPDDSKLPHLLPLLKKDDSGLPTFMGLGHLREPKHTFEVQEDGAIEVRIRKGASELVQRFADEDDLAERSPKLYRKYEKLMGLEDE